MPVYFIEREREYLFAKNIKYSEIIYKYTKYIRPHSWCTGALCIHFWSKFVHAVTIRCVLSFVSLSATCVPTCSYMQFFLKYRRCCLLRRSYRPTACQPAKNATGERAGE